MSLLQLDRTDRVARLTLNDPDRLNAMSESMAVEFRQQITALKNDPPRVLFLRGAGRAFSAGGDLDMLLAKNQLSWEENRDRMLDFYASFLCLRELACPVIAAIHGHAVGAGFCLAAACDMRICQSNAKFAAPFAKLGLHPGMGATYVLPRAVGEAAAAELMLTGRRIDAQEAFRLGLVSRVLDDDESLEQACDQLAQDILAGGPLAVQELLLSTRGEPAQLQAALAREAAAQATCYIRDELVEGVTAIKEKRAPRWLDA